MDGKFGCLKDGVLDLTKCIGKKKRYSCTIKVFENDTLSIWGEG